MGGERSSKTKNPIHKKNMRIHTFSVETNNTYTYISLLINTITIWINNDSRNYELLLDEIKR